eukprot:TRINITY_DN2218_c0_g1_i17.p1 TRINITY_DN2218_c0_g1~~TRINITY_DN2218_c0_g1_i17.p1  ORF type:complete len:230 (-),score=29.04 TRINITY_DN2218_c0_g1_i17:129-818(-)
MKNSKENNSKLNTPASCDGEKSTNSAVPQATLLGKRKKGPKKINGINIGPWTDKECSNFYEALNKYGRDWGKIANTIGARTSTQVKTHYQKKIKTKGSYEQEKIRSYIYKYIEARRNIAREDLGTSSKREINHENEEESKSNEHIKVSQSLWNQIKALTPVPKLTRDVILCLTLETLIAQLENHPPHLDLGGEGAHLRDFNGEQTGMETNVENGGPMYKEPFDDSKVSS